MKYLISIIFIFFISFSVAHGQDYTLISDIPGISDTANFKELVKGLISIVIAIGVLLAVIMLSIGGFKYMVDTTGISTKEDAKKTMTAAILGLLLLLGSYLILYIINPGIVTNISFFREGGTSTESRPATDRGPDKDDNEVLDYDIYEFDSYRESTEFFNKSCDFEKSKRAQRQVNKNVGRDSPEYTVSLVERGCPVGAQLDKKGRCEKRVYKVFCVRK